ncbi:MAG: RNA polymerase factor sigma-54 [Proteobacteria bacterium]|nr:RNA polymerase factor sigma-54 [Pseudomonadota bacterium]
MAISQRLEIRQSQSLVMTPQLQQAIKLLQLSNLDLAEYVEQEVAQNPLLEPDEAGRRADEPSDPERQSADDSAVELGSVELESDVAETPLDMDIADAMGTDEPTPGMQASESFQTSGGGRQDFSTDEYDLEQALSHDVTLQDHVRAQLGIEIEDPVQRIIGVQLVDLLNEAGYLTGDLATVAENVGCKIGDVEVTLARLQQFDPVGVFARSLPECLGLQLAERNRLDPAMRAMLDNLELLARGDFEALSRVCGVDAEDIADMIGEIKALNPKPGLAFGSEVTQTVVPDVFVRGRPNGGWMVELNGETLPKVLVNLRYYSRISSKTSSATDRAYLSERLHSANWLVKSLDQRANTILKVATEIVVQQDGFMSDGVSRLRPLNLRDIATEIEMHESTVSRVTANKYMATSRGIYPMKYFFTSAIASAGGTTVHSAETVRARIRGLIENETPEAILSDDKIVETLRRADIEIARRTVAKYREAMRIPSSVDRRRLKRRAS